MKHKLLTLSLMSLASFAVYAEGFEVHEWGTFTSFMGADGRLQEGLHHEDEPLPLFVHGLKAATPTPTPTFPTNPPRRPCRNFKIPCDTFDDLVDANERLLGVIPQNPLNAGITQKMETPVIYFYGASGQQVNVQIDFPKGLITQYYPEATFLSPAADRIRGLGPSHYEFDVTLMPIDFVGRMPVTHPDSIWNPARQVRANTIKTQHEDEKFIFYRGVGDFEIDVTVSSPSGHDLRIQNRGEPIGNVFVLHSDGIKGEVLALGALDRELQVRTPMLSDQSLPFAQYVTKTKALIADALVRSGLYRDEALALVNTWEKSYFHTPGRRVLYVLNRQETDSILPIKITPAPDRLVRSLVGRIEIMTREEEEAYFNLLKGSSVIATQATFGRFYEPKLRRLLSLARERAEGSVEQKILQLLR